MKKQTEKISKKYDFFDNEDDKKDVKIKKESDTEMDETETIPYASPKRENDIDDSETIVYSSPKREIEDEIDEKIYKEPKLETAVEPEKQAVENEKKFIKSELEQNKVDVKIEKESDIKKVQDVFEEVKKEEPINVENFFIDHNSIFDSEEISDADREFIIDLINRTNFIADAKRFVEKSKMEIVHPEEKKMKRKNKCRLMMTERKKMRALKIVS